MILGGGAAIVFLEASEEILERQIYSTSHQTPGGFAVRVHSFAAETVMSVIGYRDPSTLKQQRQQQQKLQGCCLPEITLYSVYTDMLNMF